MCPSLAILRSLSLASVPYWHSDTTGGYVASPSATPKFAYGKHILNPLSEMAGLME